MPAPEGAKVYRTDPVRASTDGDPWSDMEEGLGEDLPQQAPGNSPVVAACPEIVVSLERYKADADTDTVGVGSDSDGTWTSATTSTLTNSEEFDTGSTVAFRDGVR